MPIEAVIARAHTSAPPRRHAADARGADARGVETAHAGRRAYAALDLGTNNCRLLIARPAPEGFVVIDAFSRIVRLGEGLGSSGALSDAAQDRAVAALGICSEKLRRRGVTVVRSVATEACRRASNGAGFVRRVFEETGIALDVISPAEEARLAVLGCHALLDSAGGPALVFDIGGGSTELVLVDPADPKRPRIGAWVSAPWGVVSLTETESGEAPDDDARLAAYDRMRGKMRDAIAGFASRLDPAAKDIQLLGTSGTVTTLASLHLGLATYNRRLVDGCSVPALAMRDIAAMLAGRSLAERAELACIGTERADLVVAGCAILEAILDIWPATSLSVADRGIREGILRTLMQRDGFDPQKNGAC